MMVFGIKLAVQLTDLDRQSERLMPSWYGKYSGVSYILRRPEKR